MEFCLEEAISIKKQTTYSGHIALFRRVACTRYLITFMLLLHLNEKRLSLSDKMCSFVSKETHIEYYARIWDRIQNTDIKRLHRHRGFMHINRDCVHLILHHKLTYRLWFNQYAVDYRIFV